MKEVTAACGGSRRSWLVTAFSGRYFSITKERRELARMPKLTEIYGASWIVITERLAGNNLGPSG